MTLAEMLVATAIMGMMAAALSTIALAVQMAHEYAADQGVMAQHARVIIERIQRAFAGATASESFPGAQVITYNDSTYTFPQAIAIWRPETIALDPDGSPRIEELRFFASDPDEPNRLLEFQATGDTRPAPTTAAGWRDLVEALLDDDDVEKIDLTDLIAAPKLVAGGERSYSTLRFEMRVRPDAAEVADMRDGLKSWTSLRWPQRSYGLHSGTRQSWIAFQFQVAPNAAAAKQSSVDVEAAPFFGSASLYYTLNQ
ncbi:hypothetical protein DSM3645_24280 [Blastopirellula marina DSM 3645]|uniref:Uncharacterized protein n=2 Tax=Blastopirellula marina TaxID=124 RepID=A3ZUU7_9BACT|nr:hypothetical protein DSM3645_24280 [Blastopirellula marina DSM 3645]